MLTRLAVVALSAALLSACSSKPEDMVARAADQMNALHNKQLDQAHAEGNVLVVRYRPLPTGNFSDDELTKLTTAGLCTLSSVKGLFDKGGKIRIELPRGGDYLKIQVDRCDGATAVVEAADAAVAQGSSTSSGWPTNASIAK